ncbi:MAG: porin family protein [Cyclobacteriaceae bacterium]
MKRIILPAFLCFCCIVAQAQFSFGIKAGVNQNSVRGDKDPSGNFSFKSSTGFHLGLYGSIPLSKKLSLNPELQYIKKQLADDYFRLNYLELPVLFNYQISERFALELGPSIGQEIYIRRNPSGRRVIAVSLYDTDLDFGMIGGVKYKASNRISIVARYNYSFLPFEKFEYFDGPIPSSTNVTIETETYKFYNSSVQLSVMYRIK